MFFSIVVPVYNVESYLKDCIESILSQDFDEYELILVNDGSTDSSGDICEEYALLYSEKIKVIHKSNGGLSDARNVGIRESVGKYIIFIDSDDYITENTLNTFYKVILENKDTDVLVTRLMQGYSDGEIEYMDQEMPISELNAGSKEQVIEWIFEKSQTTWPAPRYILNRKLIIGNCLEFRKGYLHEDIDWTMKLFLHANRFIFDNHYWYIHRMGRKGSITTGLNVKRTLDIIDIVSKNVNDPSYNIINRSSKKIMFERAVASLYWSLSNYHLFNGVDKERIRKNLKQNKNVLSKTSKFKYKLFLLFCSLFGFKIGLEMIRLVKKVKH